MASFSREDSPPSARWPRYPSLLAACGGDLAEPSGGEVNDGIAGQPLAAGEEAPGRSHFPAPTFS